jgi:uncharacterized membrane protein YkoI
MRRNWWAWSAAVGLSSLFTAAAPAANDGEVALSRVPAAVLKAAARAVPGARLSKAFISVEDGQRFYEIEGLDARGREVEVEVTTRGQVLQVETTIPMGQVPRVVLDALRAKARGVKVENAEAVTRDGRLVAYEFEGENAEGDDVEVTVTTDGRSVTIDVDDDD